jgi:hypothetical protein
MQGFAKQLGPVDSQPFGPDLRFFGVGFVHPETQHRHTKMLLRHTVDVANPAHLLARYERPSAALGA